MVELEPVIRLLIENKVEFVIVGGVAVSHYGASYVTQDLDFCYSRSPENIHKIFEALKAFNPHPRDFPADLPFIFNETTIQNGINFTFDTTQGDVDLLGEVAGVGAYPEVFQNSVEIIIFGLNVRILTLRSLIAAKKAAGRTKDLLVLPELETLLELQNQDSE
jgi:predicted nucleotidyltransferase